MSDLRLGHLTRREFLRMAGLTAAGAGLAACGVNPINLVSARKTSVPVQLVYQDWRTEWFPPLAQEMLAKFNADHPNIHVFYTPDPDNIETREMQDLAAGTASDVFSGCCDFFPSWAQAGYLLDLRPYVQADIDKGLIADWDQAQYQALFTPDGKQFGLPKYHGELALYYNKDMFDAARVDYPTYGWTHDDYLDAMKKLTIRSGGKVVQWGSMFDVSWERIQVHVNEWGGHFVNLQNPAQCEMASTPALQAMEWLRARMWDDQVMATFLDVQNVETRQAFIDGRIAMVEDGSWALKDILDGAKFSVGVAPFPTGPVSRATLGTTDGFCIYAGTKHPDEAWEFMKFLVSQDYSLAMARYHFLQPARRSLVDQWTQFVRQAYPAQTRDLDLAAFADGQVKGYTVVPEVFPKMAGVSETAKAAWDQIFTLGKAPVFEMIKVCQAVESIQQNGKAGAAPCDCEVKVS